MRHIPKTIHYCWFGRKPLPPLALKCIESWKRYLPDYDIVEWNEDNFDVNMIPYTKEAYEAKKYAFVSDYARFYILYKYGGLYFDTDVEVIKSMDDIIESGPFMGCESSYADIINVAPGLGISAIPEMDIFKELLDSYKDLRFKNDDGSFNETTVVKYTTEILSKYGFKHVNEIQRCADLIIYPTEYFNPLHMRTKECIITDNTYTIHHYAASWLSGKAKFNRMKRLIFSEEQIKCISHFLDKFRKKKGIYNTEPNSLV